MKDTKDIKSSIWDKEVQVRIRPGKILKGLVFIMLLVSIFYLGRLTAPESSNSVTVAATTAAVTETAQKESASSFLSTLTGFITGLLPSSDEKTTETKKEVAVTPASGESTPTAASTATTETPASNATASPNETVVAAANTDNSVETIVTTYSKVAVSLNDVIKDWKGTWGKIVKIDYTIKNNEAGTIKPAYFIMLVEGYDTGDSAIPKKISLPLSSQSIKAGESYSLVINVPQGFAYNAITTGDLSNVRVTLQLYDSADKLMGTYNNEFNLQGTVAP